MNAVFVAAALADPVATLEAATASLSDVPSHWTGALVHEGHGPVPGHTATYEVEVHTGVVAETTVVEWRGEGFTLATAVSGRDVFALDAGAWTVVEPSARAAQLVSGLAARPDRLLAALLREPARLADGPDGAVLWASEHGMATLRFDHEARPVSLRIPVAHPVFGDVEQSIVWTWSEPAQVALTFAEADTRIQLELTSTADGPPPEPPRLPDAVEVHQIEVAPGVHALEVPDADVRGVVVVDGDQAVLLDAPLGGAIADAVHHAARALAPSATWSVVASHHHPHHAGGLRPWARDGATLYVPGAVREAVVGQLRAERHGSPDDPPVADPTVVGVDAATDVGPVHLLPIDGASEHTEAFLLPFVPSARLLYVSDLAAFSTEAERPRVRGAWRSLTDPLAPQHVVSGFPSEGSHTVWSYDALP